MKHAFYVQGRKDKGNNKSWSEQGEKTRIWGKTVSDAMIIWLGRQKRMNAKTPPSILGIFIQLSFIHILGDKN